MHWRLKYRLKKFLSSLVVTHQFQAVQWWQGSMGKVPLVNWAWHAPSRMCSGHEYPNSVHWHYTYQLFLKIIYKTRVDFIAPTMYHIWKMMSAAEIGFQQAWQSLQRVTGLNLQRVTSIGKRGLKYSLGFWDGNLLWQVRRRSLQKCSSLCKSESRGWQTSLALAFCRELTSDCYWHLDQWVAERLVTWRSRNIFINVFRTFCEVP